MLSITILAVILLAGCTGQQSLTPALPTETPVRLTPIVIHSPTISPTMTPIVTSTQKPRLPTPTPFTYTIQEGDTLFGLAIRFDTTVDEIVAANPDTNTSILSVGTELIIPMGDDSSSAAIPTPSPVPVRLNTPNCYPNEEHGLTCFVLATNDQDTALENISAVVNVHHSTGEIAASQIAYPPINILNPGESIPLMSAIPSPLPGEYQVFASLITSLPSEGTRNAVEIINQDVSYPEGRRRATVRGKIKLSPGSDQTNEKIWLVAVAWDAREEVVGMRKRIYAIDESATQGLEFTLNVYSVGPEIKHLTLYTERH